MLLGFALSFHLNSHVELPRAVSVALVYFRFIAALVGHSGLSCGPPPYWHCLSAYSQAQLDQVTLRLNQRRRKTLGFQTLPVNSRQVLRRPSEPALEIV